MAWRHVDGVFHVPGWGLAKEYQIIHNGGLLVQTFETKALATKHYQLILDGDAAPDYMPGCDPPTDEERRQVTELIESGYAATFLDHRGSTKSL